MLVLKQAATQATVEIHTFYNMKEIFQDKLKHIYMQQQHASDAMNLKELPLLWGLTCKMLRKYDQGSVVQFCLCNLVHTWQTAGSPFPAECQAIPNPHVSACHLHY